MRKLAEHSQKGGNLSRIKDVPKTQDNLHGSYSERFFLCPTGDYEANIKGLFIKFKNNSEKFKQITFVIENYKEKDLNSSDK